MPEIKTYKGLDLGLPDFVNLANQLLPDYLPQELSDQRLRGEVSPRLVRHYATQGLLQEPRKAGREARYSYRHLLQLLLVRRLMAEGYTSSSIDDLTTSRSDQELEELLRGGVQISMEPANSAVAFLTGLKAATPVPAPSPSPPPQARETWHRYQIAPGLELHRRDDFRYPTSPDAQESLLQNIHQRLIKPRRSKS